MPSQPFQLVLPPTQNITPSQARLELEAPTSAQKPARKQSPLFTEESDEEVEIVNERLVPEGQLITSKSWTPSGRVERAPKVVEMEVEKLKTKQELYKSIMDGIGSLFEEENKDGWKSLGKNERELFQHVKKVIVKKVDSWKPKIDESVAQKKKTVVIEELDDEITIVQMGPMRNKRKAASSSKEPKKKKKVEYKSKSLVSSDSSPASDHQPILESQPNESGSPPPTRPTKPIPRPTPSARDLDPVTAPPSALHPSIKIITRPAPPATLPVSQSRSQSQSVPPSQSQFSTLAKSKTPSSNQSRSGSQNQNSPAPQSQSQTVNETQSQPATQSQISQTPTLPASQVPQSQPISTQTHSQLQKVTKPPTSQHVPADPLLAKRLVQPVTALDLMTLNNDFKEKYKKGLDAMDSAKVRRAVTGYESVCILAEPVKTIIKIMKENIRFASDASPHLKLFRVKPAIFDAPSEKMFMKLLRAAPRFVQVGLPDAFWTPEKVNFSKIDEAVKAVENGKSMNEFSGSWMCLCQMFTRKDTSLQYSMVDDFSRHFTSSLSKINQCTVDSIMALHSTIEPLEETTRAGQLKDIQHAIDIILSRSLLLGGGTQVKNGRKTTKDGLNYLLKKITDLVLGLLLIHESHLIDNKKPTESLTGEAGKAVKVNHKTLKANSVVGEGAAGMSQRDWSSYKKGVFANMAIFLTFGVAGWWGLFNNHRKYKYSDIYGILTLGEQRYLNIENQGQDTIDTQHPFHSGSWKNLNSFIINLIIGSGFANEDLNYLSAPLLWTAQLNGDRIAMLFLMDVFEEIAQPGISISPKGLATPIVELDPETIKKKTAVIEQAFDIFPNLSKLTISSAPKQLENQENQDIQMKDADNEKEVEGSSESESDEGGKSEEDEEDGENEDEDSEDQISEDDSASATSTESQPKPPSQKKQKKTEKKQMNDDLNDFIDDLEATVIQQNKSKNNKKKISKETLKYMDLEAEVAPADDEN